VQVYFCPESPRWLISRNRHREAFESLCRLRHTKLQAARDLFMINALLEEEASLVTGKSAIVELFSVPRNRRATIASGCVLLVSSFVLAGSTADTDLLLLPSSLRLSSVVMFMQQCASFSLARPARTVLTEPLSIPRSLRCVPLCCSTCTTSADEPSPPSGINVIAVRPLFSLFLFHIEPQQS